MTDAIQRGQPTKAQLYLEGVIEELIAETGNPEDRYCLNKLLFKCLKDNPEEERQIDGASGRRETNKVVLERSIKTALALQECLQVNDKLLLITRNLPETLSIYLGSMFAGVVSFPQHVSITVYELKHYIDLSEPKLVIVEDIYLNTVERVLKDTNSAAKVIVLGNGNGTGHVTYNDFIGRFDNCHESESFRPVSRERDAGVLILSTSGSTGLPKAVELTNEGLVAQSSTFWTDFDVFPTPSRLVLVLSNSHWISYTMSVTNCIAFRCSMLFTTQPITIDHVRSLLRKYRPTFFTTSSAMAKQLISSPGADDGDLRSIEYLVMAGTATNERTISDVKNAIHKEGRLINGYGITETQGGVCVPTSDTHCSSIGKVTNLFHYKIINEEGSTLGPNEEGELCVKALFKFKTYLKDEKAYDESFTKDGYFRTGDKVFMNESEDIFFVERIKFLMKYKNFHVSPTELENVISMVEGVVSVVACEATDGPAAMVVTRPGSDVTAIRIHGIVNSTLSDEKHLRGGVAFVSSIPVTVNGKIDRNRAKAIFRDSDKSQVFHYE